MRKSMKRRRKAKKTRKTIANLIDLLKNIKIRVQIPPVGHAFKSIKDYNRKDNKKAAKDGLDDV
jgi:hypothetical protein